MRRNWQKSFKSRRSYFFYQKARRIDFKKASLLIMFSIVFIFLGWLSLFSPHFQIQNFEVQSDQTVSGTKINEIINQATSGKKWNLISGKNFIFFEPQKIQNEILRNIVDIETVTIEKVLPNIFKNDYRFKVIVKIQERKTIGVWCYLKPIQEMSIAESKKNLKDTKDTKEIIKTDNCYFYDINGIGYKKIDREIFATDNTFGNFPIIWEESNKEFEPMRKIAPKEFINFLANISGPLFKKTGLKIGSLKTPGVVSRELIIKTDQGFEIFFDTSQNPERTAEILARLLNEKIPPEERKNLEYIDLRIPERIYYRFRGEKKE